MKNIYLLLIAVLLVIGMISFAGTETNRSSTSKKTDYTAYFDPVKIFWIDTIIQELYFDLIGSPGTEYHYGSSFFGYEASAASKKAKWDIEYVPGVVQSSAP